MIADPNNPTAVAKRLDILIKEYELLRNEATSLFVGNGKVDSELIEKVTKLKEEIAEFTKLIYSSPNFVIPDNELTKH